MKQQVRLFAAARDIAGAALVPIELPETATVADVRQALLSAVPQLGSVVPHARFAVNAQYVADTTRLTAEDEIALIPPVSGG